VADLEYVLAPKEAAGDDHVRVVGWEVPDGSQVQIGTVVAIADTSKAAFEIETEAAGFIFHLVQPGDRVEVGHPIAVVSSENVRPSGLESVESGTTPSAAPEQNFTRKALELLQQHQLSAALFSGQAVVRHTDVEEYIKSHGAAVAAKKPRFFGDEELDPTHDWSDPSNAEELAELQELLKALRRRLKARFNRHVPIGTLLHDRWSVAREYRFGEGTSVYDECLILGDVTLGKHCWVGPFTVLDGNFAALRIGDYTTIGSGAQIYTHSAIDNVITKGRTPTHAADTAIGEACFISPLVVVGPGSRIGNHSFVASGSFVQGIFPDYSHISGSPARRVGRVEVRGDRVLLLKDP
jgi:acetyltransferase-like isoleucine patch superfamily enzyme